MANTPLLVLQLALAAMLAAAPAAGKTMQSSFLSGPNLNSPQGLVRWQGHTIATSTSTIYELGEDDTFHVVGDIMNIPPSGSTLFADPVRLWFAGGQFTVLGYTTNITAGFSYPSGLNSCRNVPSLAATATRGFLVCTLSSKSVYYYSSNPNLLSWSAFSQFDYSGGVAVDESGLFYLGIFIVNASDAAHPTYTRQQLTVDLDLVTFGTTHGYAACEGTLCASSATTNANDFAPISSATFPCKQRGLSSDWCVFQSIAVCSSLIAVVVTPGAGSSVAAGLYYSTDQGNTWARYSDGFFGKYGTSTRDDLWVSCPVGSGTQERRLYAGLVLNNQGFGLWAFSPSTTDFTAATNGSRASAPATFTLVGLPDGTTSSYASTYPILLSDDSYLITGGSTLAVAQLGTDAPAFSTIAISVYGQPFYSGFTTLALSGGVALAWDASNVILYRTESISGGTWVAQRSPTFNVSALVDDPNKAGRFYAVATNSRIFKSDSGLETDWELVSTPPSGWCPYARGVWPLAGGNLVVDCGQQMGYYDAAANKWTNVNTTWMDKPFTRQIAYVDEVSGRLSVWASSSDGVFNGVYTLGSSWLPFFRTTTTSANQLCRTPKGNFYTTIGTNPGNVGRMTLSFSDDQAVTFTKAGARDIPNGSTYNGPPSVACTETAVYMPWADGGILKFTDV
eukprot:m.240079 g.240079  ORF g.240079 m.240079 type:complete len:678 (+) comp13607_c0_seq1:62-2095(+)